jgi:hypothetical protein
MPQIGWTIQVTRSFHLDPADGSGEAYGVNLVMPWSENSLEGGRGPRAPAPAPADARAWKLLMPWQWEDPTRWQVFARPHGGGPWKTVGAARDWKSGVETGPLPVDAIGAEIVHRSAACDHAFSVSADDIDMAGHQKRSLPHAIAPLTHWPAGASNGSLRMAGFLFIDTADLAPFGADADVVCFPEFSLSGDPTPLVPGVPQAYTGFERALYAADPDLAMASQACPRTPPGWQRHKMPQPDGTHDALPLAAVRSHAARELAPLAVLARLALGLSTTAQGPQSTPAARAFIEGFAAPDALQRGMWNDVLWRWPGTGWEPAYGSTDLNARMHVLKRMMPSSQAAGVARLVFTPSAATLAAVIAGLAGRATGLAWTSEDQALWQRAAESYGELKGGFARAGKSPFEEGMRYLRAWLEVVRAMQQPDSWRQMMGPWLAGLAGGILPAPDDNQKADALTVESLRNAPVSEAVMDASALGLLSTLAVWTWICAPSGPDPHARLARQLLDQAVQPGDPANPAPVPTLAALLAGYADAADAVAALAKSFVDSVARGADPASARPRDPGLALAFESADPGPGFDQGVRGYALALCAYLKHADSTRWIADQGRAQWISDTAVLSTLPGQRRWLSANGGVWWVHETIGSTTQNGIRATRAEYHGAPICAMQADKDGKLLDKDTLNGDADADGSAAIDFLWHADDRRGLPLLGYGMHYKALVTCIDNAGGVLEPQLRESELLCAQLLKPNIIFPRLMTPGTSGLLDSAPQWHYRSAVPPGAPTVRNGPPAAAYALSDETRAHAFQLDQLRSAEQARASGAPEQAGSALASIALLVHGELVGSQPLFLPAEGRLAEHTFTIASPAAPADFVERWLNTDIVLRERAQAIPALPALGTLSDAEFAKTTSAQLADFRDRQVDNIRAGRPDAAYHPAVSAIGVAVWIDGAAAPAFVKAFPLARTRVASANGPIDVAPFGSRQVRLTVKTSANLAGTVAQPLADGGKLDMEVLLAPGSFVRVRTFALVEGAHFAPAAPGSADHRFYTGIELAADSDGVPVFPASPPGAEPYRAFGPAEFWFEAAPLWKGYHATFGLQLVGPGASLNRNEAPLPPDLLALKCNCAGSADWVRGLFIQRHEWHWTGYPVRLPQRGAIEHWLASFAGVESYREANEVSLETGFKAGAWRYGPNASGTLVLKKLALQEGARPARYAAFTARPIIRFRAWLNPRASTGPLGLQEQVFAAGDVVPGVAPAGPGERLPTPPLRWAVPLTATYAGQTDPDGNAERIACGNLLVIDDALRRTDQLSRLGGIGDTLEIDLLDTREKGFHEIGTNPIFHPNLTEARRKALVLHPHEPFGLTHDISSNALVSQTALIVTVDNAQGKWLLAKIRARRLILPETLVNSALQGDPPGNASNFVLPFRIEGDDAIPLDFALDLDPAFPLAAPAFGIILNPGPGSRTLASALPDAVPVGPGEQLRFLCSWHKRRWSGSTVAWRLQVLAQVRPDSELDWRTVSKLSGFENSGTEIPAGYQIVQVRLTTAAPAYRASQVRMSDYTDPMWLTFIGSFGRERIGHPGKYRLAAAGATLALRPAGNNVELPMLLALEETDPCFHILLVYRPLVDITRGDARSDTGALVGAYYCSKAHRHEFLSMNILGSPPPADLAGCFSYLCTVQRMTSPSKTEAAAMLTLNNFEQFVDLLFPPPDSAESMMRLLPEFIGPIATGPLA